ncbi:beta-ketoacyl synthase N-terminal-like domain-containing protein [Muriicola sp.]|uniref:beta-ketoacyl synthase N-terminal-like domain-containing protein n=1 Tax=Muriicola sp. TaxID=2020856 RepID=UPI003567B7D4
MALKTPVSIVAIESLSALGMGREKVWATYLSHRHGIEERSFPGEKAWVAPISEDYKDSIEEVRRSQSHYRKLDETVLFALAVSRMAAHSARWKKNGNFGINIGSSRGATGIFESHHRQFIKEGSTSPWTSPATTLGNISSWVAHDMQTSGPEISHSITCSTALHALLNGVAWILGGMADRFLVGGSEAPLTPFTVAQMKALKIYAKAGGPFPCRALDLKKDENTMVLGEGAAMACLQAGDSPDSLALIDGIGYATEILESSVSISTEADCFQRSMQMAMGDLHSSQVDAVVMHAPGTIKGDESEFRAVHKVFGPDVPLLTSNKWMTGHTLGASGMLSVEMAVLMLQHQVFIPLPYTGEKPKAKNLNRILVNAVGFGGNAVSILLKRPR